MKCEKHEVAEDDECGQCELDLGIANTRADAHFLKKLAAMLSKLSESKDEDQGEMMDEVVFRLIAISDELDAVANDDEAHPLLPPLAHEQTTEFVQ